MTKANCQKAQHNKDKQKRPLSYVQVQTDVINKKGKMVIHKIWAPGSSLVGRQRNKTTPEGWKAHNCILLLGFISYICVIYVLWNMSDIIQVVFFFSLGKASRRRVNLAQQRNCNCEPG